MDDNSTFYIDHNKNSEGTSDDYHEIELIHNNSTSSDQNEAAENIEQSTDESDSGKEQISQDNPKMQAPKPTVLPVELTTSPAPTKTPEEIKQNQLTDKKVAQTINQNSQSSNLDDILKTKLASYPLPDQETSNMNPLAPPTA